MKLVQYVTRIMHTIHILLCFGTHVPLNFTYILH